MVKKELRVKSDITDHVKLPGGPARGSCNGLSFKISMY